MKTLAEVIYDEILAHDGILPFDRFMELALYCPKLGYYETKKDSVGRRGDFYTSVSVGRLFGELLAFQFAEWLTELNGTGLRIVEAGAHDGTLARDVLAWIQSNRPALFEQIEYCIIEPSPCRQRWQQETLQGVSAKIQWFTNLAPSNDKRSLFSINGIVFSNELLDAFSIRRFGWDASNQTWFEWGVRAEGAGFAWDRIEKIAGDIPPFIRDVPAALLKVLPDGFTVETSPGALKWWSDAARCLRHGKLITVDYGLTADEFFLPSRKNGTLRAFFKHHFAADLLAHPGEQDLTAHVNFSHLQKAGEEAGLETDVFSNQAKFLTGILQNTLKAGNFGEWTAARGRQFQTLTHPEHLGTAFRVLVQSRPRPNPGLSPGSK